MSSIMRGIGKWVVLALLFLTPCFAQEWVPYSAYTSDSGEKALMLFDPSSVARKGISVFAWTMADDPMDRGTSAAGWRHYVEINSSRICILRMMDPHGGVHENDELEWSAIEDGTTDYDLYFAIVKVLKRRNGD